jgi:hypothetical protein
MGVTPNYQLPYPELTDPPDGPAQIKSLATATENLLFPRVGSGSNPLPYAMATASTSVSLSNVSTKSATVTLPVGRFTAVPMVIASVYGPTVFYAFCTASSAASITVGVCHRDDALVTTSCYIHWIAIQMTPVGGPGTRIAGPAPTHNATCLSEDCGNGGRTVPIPVEPDVDVFCGVCGQQIDDLSVR